MAPRSASAAVEDLFGDQSVHTPAAYATPKTVTPSSATPVLFAAPFPEGAFVFDIPPLTIDFPQSDAASPCPQAIPSGALPWEVDSLTNVSLLQLLQSQFPNYHQRNHQHYSSFMPELPALPTLPSQASESIHQTGPGKQRRSARHYDDVFPSAADIPQSTASILAMLDPGITPTKSRLDDRACDSSSAAKKGRTKTRNRGSSARSFTSNVGCVVAETASAKRDADSSSRSSREHSLASSNKDITPQHYSSKFYCSFEGCGQGLATNSHLARHMRKHTGMKPYQCIHESCEKRFARQDNMMQHYRVHEKKEKEKQKYKEKYRDCPDACSQKGKFDSRDAAVGFWRMARSTVSDISPSGADGNA